MALISDRTDNIKFILGNRSSDDDRIIQWGVEAWRELGSSVPFKELEETFEDVMDPDADEPAEYSYPEGARAVKSLFIITNSDTGAGFRPRKWDIRKVEEMSGSTGTPAVWAPYSNSILFAPTPNVALDFRWRVWMLPSITETPEDTPLLMPDDWLSVFDYLAAIQGFIALGNLEKAAGLHQLVHGDPADPSKPGLIKVKMLRDASENVVAEQGTDPAVRPYTAR